MKPINERLERIESEEQISIPAADGTIRTMTVKVPAWRDPKDGEVYLDADSVALLDKARARHLGVLAPQELSRLRERLGLTQRQLAGYLQIGEKTWTRWESGREIPSRSLNLLLLALYEGKVDIAYLRSKQNNGAAPTHDPVLRAQGWEKLVESQQSLRWMDDTFVQEEWPAPVQPELVRTEINAQWVTAAALAALFSPPEAAGRGGMSEPKFSGKTEKMPLCA